VDPLGTPLLLTGEVLSRVFRGKFVAGLRRAFHSQPLAFLGPGQPLANAKAFAAFLRTLFRENWVVYAKAPFAGPEHVLQYLARYTHRVAISNHRLLSLDRDHVTFGWKDYAHHSQCRAMTLGQNLLQEPAQELFCPRVSHASAILAGSLIVGARSCCRFAGGDSPSHPRLPKRTPSLVRASRLQQE